MLEVYYYEDSICAEKVLMTLAEKGVDNWVRHHVHLFKHEQFDPDYITINPKAQVPTVIHDGKIIRESSIICDYIDDLYPEPPLKPVDHAEIAQMREWVKEVDEFAFEAVASLSFTAVFRDRLLNMSDQDRAAYWAGQTLLDRTIRQQSCVYDGINSPYAIRALVAWERIFDKIEHTLEDGRDWLMGDLFSLAEINFAPLIARTGSMGILSLWFDNRPNTIAWWERITARPSFAEGNVGAPAEEQKLYASAGASIIDAARKRLDAYKADYSSALS